MNTRTTRTPWTLSILGALSALGLMLAACGEEASEQQSDAAPPVEQQSGDTTTQ
jgi:hypothetical protein